MIVEKINLRSQLEQKNKELTEAMEKLSSAQKSLIEKEKLATIGEVAVTVNHEINARRNCQVGWTVLPGSLSFCV